MEKVCVIGLGYIGLPTSIFLASKGFHVHGVDINEDIINSLKENKVHIEEPGLLTLLKQSIQKGKIHFSIRPVKSDVFIISVPTPISEQKQANLDYVKQAIDDIIPYLNRGNTVIIESTIPPRTIDDVIVPLLRDHGLRPGKNEILLSYCPERVIPGRILVELDENDRIVGGYTKEAAKSTAAFFEQIISGEVFETNALTAEMSKLMENTYRDVNIALANEMAKVSGKLKVNAYEAIELANRHPRVNIHQPGPGVGGHCIPVDPYFIIEKAKELTPLMQVARKVNHSMPDFILEQVYKLTAGDKNPEIAVLGLTYKGNVSDIRESPAIFTVNKLVRKGFSIKCHDPYVQEEDLDITLFSLEECLSGADLTLVLADHNMYKKLDSSMFLLMNKPTVLDTKNCLSLNEEIKLVQIGNLLKN